MSANRIDLQISKRWVHRLEWSGRYPRTCGGRDRPSSSAEHFRPPARSRTPSSANRLLEYPNSLAKVKSELCTPSYYTGHSGGRDRVLLRGIYEHGKNEILIKQMCFCERSSIFFVPYAIKASVEKKRSRYLLISPGLSSGFSSALPGAT